MYKFFKLKVIGVVCSGLLMSGFPDNEFRKFRLFTTIYYCVTGQTEEIQYKQPIMVVAWVPAIRSFGSQFQISPKLIVQIFTFTWGCGSTNADLPSKEIKLPLIS
jgi:hypothetical protein